MPEHLITEGGIIVELDIVAVLVGKGNEVVISDVPEQGNQSKFYLPRGQEMIVWQPVSPNSRWLAHVILLEVAELYVGCSGDRMQPYKLEIKQA